MTAPSPTADQLHRVDVGTSALIDYRTTLVPGLYEQILDTARTLQGLRVMHLSATAAGGGVAEILRSLVPLLRDVGIDAEWRIIAGADELFDVTKLMHNSLQGDARALSSKQWATWRRYQQHIAASLDPSDYDVVVVHDPQPAGVAAVHPGSTTRWIWRCHIDLSAPNPDTLAHLLPHLAPYDLAMFHCQEYIPSELAGPEPWVVAPAIDPLNRKNMALTPGEARRIVATFGVDPTRPLMCQISRFDPWKDPLGVVDAWRIARAKVPDLQLALIGALAADDPEGRAYLQRTIEHLGADLAAGAIVLTDHDGIGDVEVNAFQVAADVLLQKSLREGFGLTVSEALWKARPMVAGDVGGIRAQITNGDTGYLVATVEAAAARVLDVLRDPTAAAALGRAGKERVRERFLMPRAVHDHLRSYHHVLRTP